MLTSISPLGERARHNRWGITVAWYTAASAVAASSVGGLLGAAGAAAGSPLAARAGVLAAAAAIAAGYDATGRRLPGPRRQVNEDWLGRYRGWAYGAGFGAQLGAGVTTIVTTSTVWLCLIVELLAGSGLAGATIGACFGLLRAFPVLAGGRVHTYEQLQGRHRVLARWSPAAARVATGVAAAAAAALAVLAMVAA